jgi:dihydroorotase
MTVDLLIRGGDCLLPGGILTIADVAVSNGRIAAIGALGDVAAAEVIDARGLTVLPGVIDPHVHFREPGYEYKEDLESGSAGAALGGVTLVFDMPNTKPPLIDADGMADKLRRAKERMWTDFAFYMGGSPLNAERLGELERLAGCCGVKIFMGSSTGNLLIPDDETLAKALASCARRVSLHAEDEDRLKERRHIAEEAADCCVHPVWRDAETAIRATQRLLNLARRQGRRVHVLHVTTAVELELLAQNRDLATAEVLVQHLTLAGPECYERLGTLAQMNPPIRDAAQREGLWRALNQGIVDTLGSDHAPHTLEEKKRPYPESPSGMPGVQTLLPVMLDHVHHGRLSLQRLSDLVTAGPVRVYGIVGKGRIAAGYDADLTVVDLKARRTIENKWIRSKVGWTPYDGMTVTGWPQMTIVRGQVVMREDELIGQPMGQAARFQETLEPAA